jgi:hypothetical protein
MASGTGHCRVRLTGGWCLAAAPEKQWFSLSLMRKGRAVLHGAEAGKRLRLSVNMERHLDNLKGLGPALREWRISTVENVDGEEKEVWAYSIAYDNAGKAIVGQVDPKLPAGRRPPRHKLTEVQDLNLEQKVGARMMWAASSTRRAHLRCACRTAPRLCRPTLCLRILRSLSCCAWHW